MDLKTLTEINAPAGHEQPIRRAIMEELKQKGFAPYIDRMGNVIVVKEGTGAAPRKRVMVAAHMDEVGLIVTGHTDGGFLKVNQAGGIDPRVLISLPLKYMHTAVETISLDTLEEAARLLAHFVSELDASWEDDLWI